MASMIENILHQISESGSLDEISNKLGTDRKTAGVATGAALATLLTALSRNAKDPNGAHLLDQALERDHDGSLLNNLGSGMGGIAATAAAASILNHIFGNRRPAVEQSLGRSTGLNSRSMGLLLMMLAPIVLAHLGKMRRQQNMNETDLKQTLDDEHDEMFKNQPHTTSSVSSMLDADGDGDVDLSDLTKAGSGLLNKIFGAA
ncbi:MAG TPA: DUF937 domain-containing protein [bacterium]|nr:DUF937 domain-containing protein [bacterium]